MKILTSEPLPKQISIFSGDYIVVKFYDRDSCHWYERHLPIKKEQIVDTLMQIELSEKELQTCGLKSAISLVLGGSK